MFIKKKSRLYIIMYSAVIAIILVIFVVVIVAMTDLLQKDIRHDLKAEEELDDALLELIRLQIIKNERKKQK